MAETGTVSKVGRPTDYDPAHCAKVIEWGRAGKSIAWMAAELGQAKQTLYDWMKVHPEFLDAINRALTLSQQWWEDAGQVGMGADKFNSTVWAKNVSCRFRDDWTDKSETSLTGADGGAVKHVIETHIIDPNNQG